ncbi:hypothetical protein GCM10010365_45320 [Streptomyces poonensis]|uniref:UspA domain-containing protein n=1 Tax=Streptomyces poonensis TaxID=68255 RepID=A0A918PRI6_9ACTN|nr:hypothetical protein GCM10010365_45320 [Streptomyces poonensis]
MELPLVVGVDGSDSSLVAVDWAVDEAARRGWDGRCGWCTPPGGNAMKESHRQEASSVHLSA